MLVAWLGALHQWLHPCIIKQMVGTGTRIQALSYKNVCCAKSTSQDIQLCCRIVCSEIAFINARSIATGPFCIWRKCAPALDSSLITLCSLCYASSLVTCCILILWGHYLVNLLWFGQFFILIVTRFWHKHEKWPVLEVTSNATNKQAVTSYALVLPLVWHSGSYYWFVLWLIRVIEASRRCATFGLRGHCFYIDLHSNKRACSKFPAIITATWLVSF